MNVEEIREYCLTKKGVSESFPFNETTLVFKVTKIFCLLGLDDSKVSLKNDPEKNIELRAHYPETIYGGYHLNKQHWNTVELDGTVPAKLMKEMIDESYNLIVKSLTKKQKEELNNL